MLLTLKKMKERSAPWTLLEWLRKKYQDKEFNLDSILKPVYRDLPDDYCWLTYTFLPRKTVMEIVTKCSQAIITIDTPMVRKILKSAETWSKNPTSATARKLLGYEEIIYKEWVASNGTKREDWEYEAIMSLAQLPGKDPPPPYSPIAEQVLNQLTNALVCDGAKGFDDSKMDKAYAVCAKIASEYWVPAKPVRTSTPKPSKSLETDDIDVMLKYIENM